MDRDKHKANLPDPNPGSPSDGPRLGLLSNINPDQPSGVDSLD